MDSRDPRRFRHIEPQAVAVAPQTPQISVPPTSMQPFAPPGTMTGQLAPWLHPSQLQEQRPNDRTTVRFLPPTDGWQPPGGWPANHPMAQQAPYGMQTSLGGTMAQQPQPQQVQAPQAPPGPSRDDLLDALSFLADRVDQLELKIAEWFDEVAKRERARDRKAIKPTKTKGDNGASAENIEAP